MGAYNQGAVRATPIAYGPFDPYAEDDDSEAELVSALTDLVVAA